MKSINSPQEFNEIMNSDKPTLLDFYADWCGPCQTLLPTIEKLATKYASDFNIVKVNVDHNPQLANHFKVRSIPALFFVQDKKITSKHVGLQTEAALEKEIRARLATT